MSTTTLKKGEKRTSPPFRYDIVGSFLRPPVLKEARAQFKKGEISAEQLKKVEDEEIIKLVQKQKEVGLIGVTDGEFRRSYFHLDFFWGLDGVEKKVVEHGFKFHGAETPPDAAGLTGKLGCTKHPFVEHFKFLKSVAGDGVVPRICIPGPAQFLFELQRPFNKKITTSIYPNFDDLLTDIASAYRDAILSFYDAGCRNVQLDDCTWGIFCDEKQREEWSKQGVEIKDLLKTNLELDNKAIEGLPEDLVITTHCCRGNYRSTYIASGGYDPVAELYFGKFNVKGFYLEFDTERAGTFEPLKLVKNKQVVLGLFSSKFGELEDKKQIISRIEEASKLLDINQICISTQCGFASSEEGNILTEEEQWNKLRFVKEIADEIWK
jgi:methionine synthase II (cobalamin-independent)